MLDAAITILRAYFQLCLFRSEPRDMPVAGAFLIFSAVLYGLSGIGLALIYQPPSLAILSGAVETALLLGLTWLLLSAYGLRSRFIQTATAITGTGFLFSLFSLPFFLLRPWAENGNDSPLLLLVSMLLLFLMTWNITVLAHILRHAVSSSFALGVLLAVGYVWLITATLSLILPDGVP